ncbi:hypothetical protein DI272_16160 [Streptomyces sp. Act143]|uniref:hypothetical protein n=1 Tax=Streptomyces sp. Act143 TaxID=2200760 RepID=UPI000D6852E4|nr:hypothetical protein [Streptomyces sp. Act143]PWI15537.1 hypothetical protein DI272_16160 [Streptomyces sp. Act143]
MNLRTKKTAVGVLAGAAAAVALATGPALAAVTFDPATGTGFVGKGDVQTAFGWNNKQLQTNAPGVTFAYDATTHYSAVCEWITGAGTKGQKTHDITLNRHTGVSNTVAYDPRVQTQITGFTLTGFGSTSTTGTVPAVGEPCVGNDDGVDHNGTWVTVDEVGTTAVFSVGYAGTSVPLA